MADENLGTGEATTGDVHDHTYLLWRIFWAATAALVTFLGYRYHTSSESTLIKKRILPPSKKGRVGRRNTHQILESVYSSARVQAAKMKKSSCLLSALGIEDSSKDFEKITDKFHTVQEVASAVKKAGLETTNLIFGIDFTKSNLYNGRFSFGGKSLHQLDTDIENPYQRVISILGKTLAPFDKDGVIPVFGFGDKSTEDKRVFRFSDIKTSCHDFKDVVRAYNHIVPHIEFGGPTDFAPLIREAVRIVEKSGQYHILVIIGDGQVTALRRTQDAIVEASHYPLSIIMVGVGDGPWDLMEEFDDKLPKRKFDNFQFVHFESTVASAEYPEPTFALQALMEIPDQFREIKKQGLLGRVIKEE